MAYKNKNIVKDGPFFTHFASLPLRFPQQRQQILQFQQKFRESLHSSPQFSSPDILREHNHKVSHLTLFKLILRHKSTQERLSALLTHFQEEIHSILTKYPLEVTGINYFTRLNKSAKCKEVTVIYLELAEDITQALTALTDKLIRALLKEEIIVSQELKDMNVFYDHTKNLYRPETLHISLFRANNLFESEELQQVIKKVGEECKKMRFQWTSFDISTMKEYDEDEFYLPLIRFQIAKKSIQN